MCLILLAVDSIPQTPLLLLGNRDEFHGRASAAAEPWAENAHVVGGRDLVAGGSWLALRDDGRFAVLTNVRSGLPATAPRSRGALVAGFVRSDEPSESWLGRVRAEIDEYGPFNLMLGEPGRVLALGSSDGRVRRLEPGVHVISNGAIGVRWPKVERLRALFAATPARPPAQDDEGRLLDLLLDEHEPADEALPHTGVGRELERALAPIFVRGERYGTRASTLVVCAGDGSTLLRERRFGPQGAALGEGRWLGAPGAGFAGGALARTSAPRR